MTQASSGINQQSFIDFGGAAVIMVPDGLSAVSDQLTVEQLKQRHEEGAHFKAVSWFNPSQQVSTTQLLPPPSGMGRRIGEKKVKFMG